MDCRDIDNNKIFKTYYNKNIQLKKSDTEGRYLIAAKDISVGEVLLKCKSFYGIASDQYKKQVCYQCIKPIEQFSSSSSSSSCQSQKSIDNNNVLKCDGCNEVFYCSSKCKSLNIEQHKHYECRFIKKLKVPSFNKFKFQSDSFTEVRMILGILSRYYMDKILNQPFIVDEINSGDGIDDEQEYLTNVLDDVFDLVENQITDQNNKGAKERVDELVEFITDILYDVLLKGLKAKLNKKSISLSNSNSNIQENEVEQQQQQQQQQQLEKFEIIEKQFNQLVKLIRPLICKVRCNQFGIWSKKDKCLGVAVSPSSSYFNHSCIPNCADIRDGKYMKFISLYPIKKGTPLCISYLDLDRTKESRNEDLKLGYYFECRCQRCLDTTDQCDNWISKFYCETQKCDGLYYSITDISSSSSNHDNDETIDKDIKLICTYCDRIKIVKYDFFDNQPLLL
ncbi:hypothetical protein CYY_009739 [Polysphondylium violaceum]|uniref:SET domain-containing protein n=1 Tax=Polysphondylium violaceum TaxID=133409 RepID=A0A8J4PLT3_9MYCE|nr:hypothetical protein CYY_009739 [Polysphondylium violaceum]